ncbi:MBG domain-containing protein [Microcella sp.]|uniref:MBG domain-containing protein n=1 Tax=Microcella sp. TaxID=1913979 RepID=UPI0025646667|nr:MBG domain-containing protein [Microcella sp.]MBX9471793.1 IPT/TIG domain-containing protein [Microcella sp.]
MLIGVSLIAPAATAPAWASSGSITSVAPDQGTTLGGTAIEIVGTGFGDSGTPVVTIGGNPATSVVRHSDTLVTAVTPAGSAGAATVAVTPQGGEPITRVGAFEYRSSFAAPTITTVAPSEGSAPGGELVTIGGSGLYAVTHVRFGSVEIDHWSFVDRGANGSSITIRAPQRAPGTVDVAVVTSTQVVQRDDAYRYLQPTVTSMTPTSGPETGGTRVTITGAGFGVTGTPSVTIGGVSATAITRVSSTSIQATTPSGVVGSAPVVVRITAVSPALTATGSLNYTYAAVPTAPTITAVTPNRGPLAGGENVTITGTNFTPSTTVTFGDNAAAVQSVVAGGTSMVVRVPAGAAAAAVSVRVTNAAGAATLPRGYTYAAVPSISSVSPSTVLINGGGLITVAGSGFGASGTPVVTVGGRPATCVVRTSDTQLTAVAPDGFAGPATVTVAPDTRGGTATLTNAVTYAAATTTPTISSISPSSGITAGGTSVTISGTGFGSTTPVVRFGTACAAAIISHSPTSIVAVAPPGTLGAADLSVTMQTGRVVSTDGFTYTAPPTFSAVSPNWGYSAGDASVTIVGRGFGEGTPAVTFDGVPATVTSSTDEFIYVTVPPGTVGAADVVVTPQGGTPLPKLNAFTYRAALVQSLLPEAGPESGGTTVTITGEGFGSGTPSVTFGGVPATSLQLQSSTRITVVTPAGTGAADVRVTPAQGSGNGVLSAGYRYVPEIRTPIITSSLPVRAPQSGGTLVTVLGEHFLGSNDVAASVWFERGGVVYAVSDLTVVDQGRVTFRTPALASGVYQLRVTTNEGFALLNYALTVPYPPVIDSCSAVSPRYLYLDENPGDVTVTGTGFGDGTPVVTIGGVIAEVVSSTDTSVRFEVPPSLAPGNPTVVVYPSTGAGAFEIASCLTAYATLTIDPDDTTINYGDPTPVFTSTTSGLRGGDTIASVRYIFSGEYYYSTTPPTRAGVYTITVDDVTLDPGRRADYSLERLSGTFTIIGQSATVRTTIADRVYGSTESITTTATGLIEGDELHGVELVYQGTLRSGSSFGPTLAAPTGAGDYTVTPRNADVGENTDNYDFLYIGDSFRIDPRPITITIDDVQKQYGQVDPEFTYQITTGSLVEGDVLEDLLVRDAGEDVRPANLGYRITGDADAGPNYLMTIVDGRLFITPKPISVSVADAVKYYGDDDPQFTVIAQGLVGDDELELTISRDPGEDVAFYDIHADGESPTLNYEIVETESGQLRIDPRPITVGINDLTLTYGDPITGWSPRVLAGSLAFSDTLGTVTVELPEATATPRDAGDYTGTATAVQIVGGNAANYDITYGTGLLTIDPKHVFVQVGSAEIAYLDPEAEIGVTATGLLPGHDVIGATFLYSEGEGESSAAQPTAVGEYAIELDWIDFGTAAGNYDVSSTGGSFTITRRALQVSVADASKTYGQVDPQPVVSLAGDSIEVELSGDDRDAVEASVSRAAGDYVGSYDYLVDADAESNFVIEIIDDGALTITPKAISVTAEAATKVYGDADPTFVAVSNDLVGDDELTGTLTRATGESVGAYPVQQGTVDNERNPNYTITFTDGEFEITQRAITVAVVDDVITYGDDVPAFTIEVVSGALLEGHTLNGAATALSPEISGRAAVGSYTVTPSELALTGGAVANYAVTYQAGTLEVQQRELTVTVEDQTIGFGEPVAAVTIVSTGLQAPDVVSDFSVQFRGIEGTEYGPSTTAPEAAGTYAIELVDIEVGAETANYSITAVDGTLTIEPGPLVIIVNDASKVYGDSDPQFTVDSSAVTGISESDVAAIEAALVRVEGENVGEYAISIEADAALNYEVELSNEAPTPVLRITARPIVVTIDNAEKQVGDNDPFEFTYSVDDLVSGDSLSGAPERTGTEVRGTHPITAGTLDAGTNYTMTVNPGTFTITTRSITVAVGDESIAYGDSLPTWQLEVVSGSLRDGDDIVDALIDFEGEGGGRLAHGTYTATPSSLEFSGTGTSEEIAADYVIEYESGTLTVTPREITIAINDAVKIYGDADPAFTVDDSALLDGDSLTGAAQRDEGEAVGDYTIGSGTLSAGENYDVTWTTGTLTINQRAITITATDREKVYGEADPALTWSLTDGTIVEGDTLEGLLQRARGDDVIDGGYAITGVDGAEPNYDTTVIPGTFTITPATISIAIDNAEKEFGTDDPTFTYEVTGLLDGDTLSGAPSRDEGEGRGTWTIRVGTLDAGDNYAIGTVTNGTLTITPRAIVVGVLDREIDYGQADGAFTPTIIEGGPLVGDDDLTSIVATVESAASPRPVGTYDVSTSDAVIANGDAADYAIEYRSGTLTVSQLAITISIADAEKQYLASDPSIDIDDSALLEGDALSGAATREEGELVGEYDYTQGTLDAGLNYAVTWQFGALTIVQLPVVIDIADDSKVYGEGDPSSFDFTAPEGVALSAGDLEAIAALIGRESGDDAGDYALQLSGSDAGNVTVTGDTATFTIDPKPITVSAVADSKIYGDDDPALQAQSAGLVGSDELAGTPSRAAGEGVGGYLITQGTVETASNPNYVITWSSEAELTIEQRPLELTIDDGDKVYGEPDPSFTTQITSGSLVGTDAITGSPVREVGADVDDYVIARGTVAVSANYDLTVVSGTFTITSRPISIDIEDAEKEFGDDEPESFAWSIGEGTLVGGDEIMGAPDRAAGENRGEYAIGLGSLSAGSNYALSTDGGTFTITPRAVTVTVLDAEKVFGEDDPEFEFEITVGSLLDESDAAIVAGELGRDDTSDDVGEYEVTAQPSPVANYVVTAVPGTLTISKRPVTVTPDDVSKTYGESDPSLTFSVSNGVEGEPVLGTLSRAEGENVGGYAITGGTVANALNPNYTVTVATGSELTIEARPVTVTVGGTGKTYGDADPDSLGAVITDGSLVGEDLLEGAPQRAPGEDAGTYVVTRGTLDLGANYELTVVDGTFTIAQRTLTLALGFSISAYGEPIAPAVPSVSGLQFDDAIVGQVETFDGSTVVSTEPGMSIRSIQSVTTAPGASSNYVLDVSVGTHIIAGPTALRIDPAEGLTSGGLPFTITGSGFGAEAPEVLFDGVPATEVVLEGHDRISGLTPAHDAATVDVTVVTGAGETVLTQAYTYVEPIPGPVVLSMSPGFGPVDGGTEITVTGAHLVGSDGEPAEVLLDGVPVADVRVADDGESLIAVTAPAPEGPRDVDIMTYDGGTTFFDGFTYVPGPAATLDGTLWLDLNGDGVLDADEPGLPGVGLSLVPVEIGPSSDSVSFESADAVAAMVTSDANGEYSFGEVPFGTYQLVVQLPAGTTMTAGPGIGGVSELITVDDTTTDLAIGLAGDESLTITVTMADGEPVPGATVEARWSGVDGLCDTADDLVLVADTDIEGQVRFTGVPAGLWCVTASATGWQPQRAEVETGGGADATLSIVLGSRLAATGAEPAGVIGLAIALLLGGALAIAAGGRRRLAQR